MQERPVRMRALALDISQKSTAQLAGFGQADDQAFRQLLARLEHRVAGQLARHPALAIDRVLRHGMFTAAEK